MYHRGGIDDFTKRVTDRLSAAGYLVAVPDVSHRIAPDIPMTDRKKFLKDFEVVATSALPPTTSARGRRGQEQAHHHGPLHGRPHGAAWRRRTPGFQAASSTTAAACISRGATRARRRSTHCATSAFRSSASLVTWTRTRRPNRSTASTRSSRATEFAHTFHRYDDAGHGFQNRTPGSPGEQAAAAEFLGEDVRFLRATVGD